MHPNLFGTDGIRTLFGEPPLSAHTLPHLGTAIGQWIVATYGQHAHVLMISDTRISGESIKTLLFSGMRRYPLHIFDAGVLPTPGAELVMQETGEFQCALVLSASHNPYQYNGIKIIDAHTGKIREAAEQDISTRYYTAQSVEPHPSIRPPSLAASADTQDERREKDPHSPVSKVYENKVTLYPQALELYKTYLIKKFPNPFLTHKKIVIDCANGAASAIAPHLFAALGAEVIALHCSPNGTNINEACGSTHPTAIIHAVRAHQAYAGFAFDGDADRLIAANAAGELIDGDDMLGLLQHHPLYTGASHIVGTVMSNEGLAAYLATQQKKLLRADVGEKYVARILQQEQLPLGGEPSGHIIMTDHGMSSDGIFCALRLLETMHLTHNQSMRCFQPFPCASKNIAIAVKKKLDEGRCARLIEQATQQLPGGRLVVRYSGTEPVLRISAQAPISDQANYVVNELAHQLAHELS